MAGFASRGVAATGVGVGRLGSAYRDHVTDQLRVTVRGGLGQTDDPARGARGTAVAAVVLVAGVAAVLRLPFVGVPLNPDEGGYAHLGLRWAGGERLYTDLWVDRPQGLLLVYRAVVAVAPTPTGLRLAAALAAAMLVVATAAAAWALGGRRAGLAAAGLLAAVGVAPRMGASPFRGSCWPGSVRRRRPRRRCGGVAGVVPAGRGCWRWLAGLPRSAHW